VLGSPGSIAAIVVTYNRKSLLRECLTSLLKQTHALDEIIVVDNASTDGTDQMLAAEIFDVTVLSLPSNLGGTGGFAKGMQFAQAQGHQWMWLMDDDLLPSHDALAYLMQVLGKVNNPQKTFIGGLAQDESGNLVWNLKVGDQWKKQSSDFFDDDCLEGIEVDFLPFLGLLIPVQSIVELGLPRTDYFVYLDDVEYCYRAKKNGYAIVCAPQSTLYHPLPQRDRIHLFHKTLSVEHLPVWKSYYEVRNRVLLGLEYEGKRFWVHLLPVILLRIVVSLIRYGQRVVRFRMQVLGLWDGFRANTNRRVVP